jgi:hypothetical protein
MTRLVLALVTVGLIGTGCDGSSDAPRGSLDLTWSFIRTTFDTSTFRYGCDAAGVDSVVVTFGRGGSVTLPCWSGAVEGGLVQRAPAGAQVVTLTGYRGSAALYESSFDVAIPERGTVLLAADVFGIPDDLDIYAWFLDANGIDQNWNGFLDTCDVVQVATLSWSLVDWAGTVVDSAEFPCTEPPGVSYRGASALDRDQYVIRMQGRGPTGTLEFDSATTRVSPTCSGQPFDHIGPSIDNFAWDVLLFDVATNATVCDP